MQAGGRHAALDPRVARSRAVIIAAATDQFLANGYLAANVDEIARQARVSKRTIYNIFGGKEQLFREILSGSFATAERFCEEVAATLAETDDVAGELTAIAIRLAHDVLGGGRVVTLRRLLIGEAARFPELVREYYDRAPGRVIAALAEGLAEFNRRGLLRADDTRIAAEHFAFLVLGASLDRALFITDEDPPSPREIERRALEGVATFLRAYCRELGGPATGVDPGTRGGPPK